MESKGLLVAVIVASALLAGCSGKSTETSAAPRTSQAALAEGKGAVNGLLIDDIYRPIPDALVLLQGSGLTATTDSEGQFSFLDVSPKTYIAIASAPGHEAAPVNVDVVAGQYTDLEIQARRIFSTGSQVVTTEFSAFIPCAADFVANGVVANCLLDLSGDSYRAGFTTKNVTGLNNITFMVTEAKVNKVGNWNFQVRENNGNSGGGERYAVATVFHSDYIKIVNEYNVTNTVANDQNNNVPWTGDKPFTTILFYQGQFKNETTGAAPVCCGVGADFGIKAKFVQSIFLGKPAIPIEEYCVLATKCN